MATEFFRPDFEMTEINRTKNLSNGHTPPLGNCEVLANGNVDKGLLLANTERDITSEMSLASLTDNTKQDSFLSENTYLPWNDYFMGLCFLTSARSKDPNTKVGACIVDKENRIISMGYNGMPRGINDKNLPWTKGAEHNYDTKYPYVCHAEMNAIMNGRKADLEDSCLYSTKFPCAECAKLIIQAGISRVIFSEKKPDPVDEQIPSRRMFALAGVICKKFIPSVHTLSLNIVDGEGSVSITK